jgi:hypothetical protein
MNIKKINDIYIATPHSYSILSSSLADQLLWNPKRIKGTEKFIFNSEGIHQICGNVNSKWNFYYKKYMAMKSFPKSVFYYELLMKNIIWNEHKELGIPSDLDYSEYLIRVIEHQSQEYIDYFLRSNTYLLDQIPYDENKDYWIPMELFHEFSNTNEDLKIKPFQLESLSILRAIFKEDCDHFKEETKQKLEECVSKLSIPYDSDGIFNWLCGLIRISIELDIDLLSENNINQVTNPKIHDLFLKEIKEND